MAIVANPQYRYKGKFISKEKFQELQSQGISDNISVSYTGAVSTKQVKNYLNTKKIEEGFSQQFVKEDKTTKINDNMSKLFDTLSKTLENGIQGLTGTLLNSNKESINATNKLINLTASIANVANSQKSTFDELYKILDINTTSSTNSLKNIEQLLKSDVKKDGKESSTSSGKDKKKADGMSAYQKRAEAALLSAQTKKETAMQKIMAEMLKLQTQKQKEDTKKTALEFSIYKKGATIVSKDGKDVIVPDQSRIQDKQPPRPQPAPIVRNKSPESDTGIGSIIGGVGLLGIGALIKSFLENESKVKETVENFKKISDTISDTADTIATHVTAIQLIKNDAQQTFKEISDIFHIMKTKEFWVGMVDALSEVPKKSIQNIAESTKESVTNFGKNTLSGIQLGVEAVTDIGQNKPMFEPPENIKGVENTDEYNKQVEAKKLNKNYVEQKAINPEKYSAFDRKVPQSKVISDITNQVLPNTNISAMVEKPIIKDSTSMLKESTNMVIRANEQRLAQNIGQQMQNTPIIIKQSDSGSSVQNINIMNKPSPNNKDNSKQLLDRLSLTGQYLGIGTTLGF